MGSRPMGLRVNMADKDAVLDAFGLTVADSDYNLSRQGLDVGLRLLDDKLRLQWVTDETEKQNTLYMRDPGKYVWDQFGYELKDQQEAIMKAVAAGDDTGIMSGHKCGKTFVLAVSSLFFIDAKGTPKTPTKVLTTAPGQRQLKHVLWAEIGHLYNRWKRKQFYTKTKGMHLYRKGPLEEDWFCLGVYSNEAGKIEGFHTKTEGTLLAVVDEGKQIEQDFFEAVTSMAGQKLVASVPPLDGQGYFPKIFKEYAALWTRFRMSTLKSSLVTKEWIEARRIDWIVGSAIWQSKIEGRIPTTNATDLVFALEDIELAQLHWLTEKLEEEYTVGIGCDVARFGEDLTVNTLMRGTRLSKMKWYNGRDLMETVGALREMAFNEACRKFSLEQAEAEAKKIPIWVDDTGLGGGVSDRLKELEYNVTRVTFGSSSVGPKKELYANIETQLWMDLADDMKLCSLPPDHTFDDAIGRLVAELASRKYKYTSTGKKLEPKADFKARVGRSPDHGDSLALANGARKSSSVVGMELW